jgi:hypothetical protein
MAQVTLFPAHHFEGPPLRLTNDASDLRDYLYNYDGIHDWNDAVSSLVISPGTQATFYRDIDFNGPHSKPLGPGSYDLVDLNHHGIPNDWISSVDITPLG